MNLQAQASQLLGIAIVQHGQRYAYFADETSEGYWLSREDLQYAIDLSRDPDRQVQFDLYSHWCTATGALMTPEEVADVFDH